MKPKSIIVFLFTTLLICSVLSISSCKEKKNAIPIITKNTCKVRAVFGNPKESEYILPYLGGKSYHISQPYCYRWGGHNNQLAYDFDLPIGDTVCASRAGIVMVVREDLEDTGEGSRTGQNHIYILHSDSSVAFYAHLKKNAVFHVVSDTIAQGEAIALSGNSGDTGGLPHLHFGVFRVWPPKSGEDIPVNFKNAEEELDSRGGLKMNKYYTALPY